MAIQLIDLGTVGQDGADGDVAREAFEKCNDNFTGLDTNKVDKTISVNSGTGLVGGGGLSTNRTLSVSYGNSAGTSTQGNDARLSDAREWTATTISQAEAEAGTATTRRAWTAERVRQAILGWWNSSAFKTKLDGIATGATANATDAQLRDRATHTGVQAISTVTGLQTALDGKQPLNSNLTAFAGLSGVADRLSYFTGDGALSLATLTAQARTLLAANTQAAQRSSMGLGNAALSTVQAGFTDNTAGALMAVGAFGLGGLSVNTAFDAAIASGVTSFGSVAIGQGVNGKYPFGIEDNYEVLTQGGFNANRGYQIAVALSSGRVFTRSRSGAVNTAWAEVFTKRSILGTVSQSGGVPTGAIIESGSNANGEYVRFADGTQLATKSDTAITTEPATFVGTITKVGSNKLWIGRWF